MCFMKLALIGLVIFSLFRIEASAQWTDATTTTTDNLKDMFFVDAYTGYCVGDNGTFLKTTNEGELWSKSRLAEAGNLNGVFFFDENHGYVCSDSHLLKTEDGGLSFINITTELLPHPITPSIAPISIKLEHKENLAIVRGDWVDTCVTLFTTDTGNSWTSIHMPVASVGRTIDFSIVDENILYAVISADQFKSTDGGITWTHVRALPFALAGKKPFKIFDVNGKGYAGCGYGTKFVTMFSDVSDSLTQNEDLIDPHSYHFIDTASGYWLKTKKMYKTTDRGLSKTVIAEFDFFENYSNWFLYFKDNNRGFIYGENGKILYNDSVTLSSKVTATTNIKLSIHPNPATSEIEIAGVDDIKEIVLVNSGGSICKIFKAQTKYSLKGLAKGVYILWVKTRAHTYSESIVIQ